MALKTVDDYIDLNLVHSIHVSERLSFRGCRRRWHWVYRDMYYPQVTAKPLEFGIAFHKAMEHWFDPDTWGIDDESRETETLVLFKRECLSQKKTYLDKLRAEEGNWAELEPEVEKDYQERVELGQAMLRSMFKTSYEIDAEYRPVGVEVPFEVPIKDEDGNTIWCKCQRCWTKWCAYVDNVLEKDNPNWTPLDQQQRLERTLYWKGLPVTYGGRVDCIFQDRFGRIWIVDWKTAARLSTGDPGAADDYLYLDDQITSYCWAFFVLGLDVAGFIYHQIKKSAPVEPEPLKRRRLGALYSQNKQADFDYNVYLTTVQENDPGAYADGVYDAFLEYLKENASPLYKRHTIHRNTEELRQAGINIALEALDMTDPGLRIYPSSGRFSCKYCAFHEPCLGKNRGEDVQYTLDSLFEKRTKMYYEEAESSTDKPTRG